MKQTGHKIRTTQVRRGDESEEDVWWKQGSETVREPLAEQQSTSNRETGKGPQSKVLLHALSILTNVD